MNKLFQNINMKYQINLVEEFKNIFNMKKNKIIGLMFILEFIKEIIEEVK